MKDYSTDEVTYNTNPFCRDGRLIELRAIVTSGYEAALGKTREEVVATFCGAFKKKGLQRMDRRVWPWIMIDGSEWVLGGRRGKPAEGKSDEGEREEHGGHPPHRIGMPAYNEPPLGQILSRYTSLPI
jgi:hypothetical protein